MAALVCPHFSNNSLAETLPRPLGSRVFHR
jgi:hypothetical protein